ncbi:hypothetical protein [Anaerosacchariphilus polymeriproducens]|uniref:Uncharacterized protein n=1 Tax=Anaerosacchariphilus polymeriproducens TaxID=1812858 RepID=A0A371AYR1_9FIRM|nr:hypothetical protein [Anaerosacchariphilus polymeriproducens]RDU24696.1 hypothetical protein DWV06_04300 [Anaerosacchariphilus polymeriproducens]
MKEKKLTLGKKLIIGFVVIIIFLLGAALTYRIIKTQGVIEGFVENSKIDSPCFVLAAQKSGFKEEVVKQVVDKLKKEEIQIRVMDVTQLSELDDSEWDGMVILTTVESGQIQKDSHKFLKTHVNEYNRIGVVFTADSNSWKQKDIDIDAVSSASLNRNVNSCVDSVLEKSYDILKRINEK